MADSFGVSAVGGNRTSAIDPEHKASNFHATPGGAGEALLGRFPITKAWECACGDGALSKVLQAAGAVVLSTDLVDRGYGRGGQDFLKVTKLPAADADIITNPPFDLAEEFIRHAVLTLRPPRLFLLLKATYWHAERRLRLWDDCRPSWVCPLTFRLDFTGAGSPTMELAWFVWERDDPSPDARFYPLRENGGRAKKTRASKWDIV
jgi:hypothetical protein